MDRSALEKVKELAKEVAVRENCLLYDVEWTGGSQGKILRVYIDKASTETVSLEDCSKISRALDLALDAEAVIPGGKYFLEVSSPGVERILREYWHFEKAVGEEVKFESREAFATYNPDQADKLGNRRRGRAWIVGVQEEGSQVKLKFEGNEILIPVKEIEKAHVVFNFNAAEQKKR